MLTRVGDQAQHARLAGTMLSVQARTRADAQAIASGKAAATYREVADRTGALLRAEDARELRGSFARQNDQLLQKLQVMDSALGSIVGLAEQARTKVVQRLNGATGSAVPLDSEMDALLDQVAHQLNATYGGQYLFAGSASDTPAVELPPTPVTINDASLFYRGDTLRASTRIDVGQELQYGVLAGDPPFAALIAGLGTAAQAHAAGDQAGLSAALDQITAALDGVIEQRSVLGVGMAQVEATTEAHRSGLLYLDAAISDIVAVDLAEVTARLANDQASLEAAYLVTGRLSSLSLADYLR